MTLPFRPLVLASALAFALSTQALADDARALRQPAQPLGQALTRFAAESGVLLGVDARLVAGKQAPALDGRYTARAALDALLAGSGLMAVETAPGRFRVEADPAAGQSPAVPLPEIQVRGASVGPAWVAPASSLALRSDTPIQQIPQSVVAVPRALIDDQDSQTLGAALSNVSNVRGFDQRDVTTGTDFRVRGFSAGVIVDGVSVPGYFAQQEPLVNVERIDVVKGPAGSLYSGSQSVGSRSVGGAIGIESKAPLAEARREVGVRAGNWGERGIHADLNQPLSPEWSVRLVAEANDSGSESDFVDTRRRFIAPSLAWRPDADRELVLRLRRLDYDYADMVGLPAEGTVTPGAGVLVPPGAFIPRSRNFTAPDKPDSTVQLQGVNLHWRQTLSDIWSWQFTLAQNTSRIDSKNLFPWNFFGFGETYPSRLYADMRSRTLSTSATAKIATGEVKHTVTAGVEIDRTRDDGYIAVDFFTFYVPDYLNPVYPAWSEPPVPNPPEQRNRYRTDAAYVQEQADFGRLHLLGGLRFARIKVDDVNTNPFFNFDNHTTETRTTPRIGASVDLTDEVALFAGYGEGFKVPVAAAYATPPKPETSAQTEIGVKLANWHGMTATLAAFDLTRQNVTAYQGLVAVQVGEQRSRGVDLDLVWQVDPSWSWLFSASRQNAEITDNAGGVNVGNQLFAIPDTTARLASRYEFRAGPLAGLGVGLGLTHHSRLPGDNDNSFFTPAATLWDAQASYRVGGLKIGVSVTNLTDHQYYTPSTNTGFVFPAPRRSVALNVSTEF